jgi:hypothetical protein
MTSGGVHSRTVRLLFEEVGLTFNTWQSDCQVLNEKFLNFRKGCSIFRNWEEKTRLRGLEPLSQPVVLELA